MSPGLGRVVGGGEEVGGGGRLEVPELGAADEKASEACSHETLAVEGGSRV